MPENLPDHEHCAQCDDAIPVGQKYCSPECETLFIAKLKKEKQRNLLFIVVVIVVFIGIGIASTLLVS
jgi:predicted nucleic acid-binding Zn ribbon protein